MRVYERPLCTASIHFSPPRKMHSIAHILPPEIIREIYGYFHAPMRLHRLNEFPWYLGQICAPWRSIFHSMVSNFWNKLDIDLNIMDKYCNLNLILHHYDFILLLLRYFLDHTRGRPFSFQFKTRPRARVAEEDERMLRLFELLVAESIRWREINIRVTVLSPLPILYKAKHHMPLLSSAQLVCAGGMYPQYPQYMHDLFEDVPHLTHLELASFSNWRVNWAFLRVLKFACGYYRYDHHLISVLRKAKRLEELALHVLGSYSHMVGSISLINLPNLKVLSTISAELLPLLQTPSLEELYIQGSNTFLGLDRLRNNVISFLTRSSCQLKCLGVAECGVDFLTDVLRSTPDLLQLNLDTGKDMVKSFSQLAFRHSNAPLACHLQSLVVVDRGFSFMELMELSVLLASRTEGVEVSSGAAPVEKLQKLTIITSSKGGFVQYNKRSAVQTLGQQCAEQGVEFTVQHTHDIRWSYDNMSILDW